MLRTLFAALVVATLVACGGDDGPTAPAVPNIGGLWNYSDNISSSSAGVSCNSSGTATINQSGGNFTGAGEATDGVCTGPGGTFDNTGSFNISGGQITGNQVSFQAPNCQFTGTISGSPPNQMSGTETCVIAISGTNHTFTGPWQASR